MASFPMPSSVPQSKIWRTDFVAIQPFSIDTLTAPVKKMIKAGVPVIDMDALIAPLEQIDVHSFLAPDNEFMGAALTQVLMDQIGGEGIVVMTQGALGHTGAQGAPAVSGASSRNIQRLKWSTPRLPIGT